MGAGRGFLIAVRCYDRFMPATSIRQLMEAGVHFGHRTRDWNPKAKRFIFAERSGTHIIDLTQTQSAIDEACEFLRDARRRGRNIVFVGTTKTSSEIIEAEARRCGAGFVNRRWLGGSITNFETMRRRIRRLIDLEDMKENGEIFRRSKKELVVLNREVFKLEKSIGGLKWLRGPADVLVIVGQNREVNAVAEARSVGCSIVSLIDSNCDPTGIDFPIPANDDSARSVRLIIGILADAILDESETDDDNLAPSMVPKRPHPSAPSLEVACEKPHAEHDSRL